MRLPLVAGRPSQGSIRLAQMGEAPPDRADVDIRQLCQRLADSDALELGVRIARVLDGGDAGVGADLFEFGAAPAQQRPDQAYVGAGRGYGSAHSGEALHPGATAKAHDERFDLIVEVMGRHQGIEAALPGPARKHSIARIASPFLQCSPRLLLPLHGQDRVGNAELPAKSGNHLRFAAALGAEAMVDGRHFNEARPRRGSEQQQGEAIGTAGDRQAKPRLARNQRIKVAAEPFD